MSEQLWGQDTEQVRALAETFGRSAQNLESSRDLIERAVMNIDGWGTDVEEMRERWATDLAPSMTRIVDALRGAGDVAARNADEQDATSDSYDGAGGAGPFAGASAEATVSAGPAWAGAGVVADGTVTADGGGLGDWFGDRLDDAADGFGWVTDQVSDGAGWISDTASDLGDWFSDTTSDIGDWISDAGSTIGDSFGSLTDSAGLFWDATGGSILDGRWPRTTEVVASGVMFAGSTVDTLLTTVTAGEVDLNLFDDGDPSAGPPQPVDPDDVTYPHGLDDLTRSVTDAYTAGDGNVRITTIDSPEGPRVIVSVPGTEPWTPGTGDIPNDLAGNLVTAAGGTSTMTEAVALAMQNADIPPDAEVLLVGHSQGGMTVADLASNSDFVSEYNVTNAITFGSPIDSDHMDPNVNVLEMQHQGDLVPLLDMEDSLYIPGPAGAVVPGLPSGYEQAGPHHTEVTFGTPSGSDGRYDVLGNHSHENYTETIAGATNPNDPAYDPAVAAYERQLIESGFLGENYGEGNTSAVDIQLGRNH